MSAPPRTTQPLRFISQISALRLFNQRSAIGEPVLAIADARQYQRMATLAHTQLIDAARAARENAHAPFSEFKVGAALRSKSGKVYTGCNVENASYGLTVCAERTAIFKAISEGERPGAFDVIAVFTAADKLTPPCGACRQIIWEFCGDCEVILSNTRGETETFKMSALLPRAFDASNL